MHWSTPPSSFWRRVAVGGFRTFIVAPRRSKGSGTFVYLCTLWFECHHGSRGLGLGLLLLTAFATILFGPPLLVRATALAIVVLTFVSLRHGIGNAIQRRFFTAVESARSRFETSELHGKGRLTADLSTSWKQLSGPRLSPSNVLLVGNGGLRCSWSAPPRRQVEGLFRTSMPFSKALYHGEPDGGF
jgi:hypothetical protein